MRILVATECSPAFLAVENALALRPWPSGTEIQLIHVVDPTLYATAAALIPHMVKTAEENMAKAIERLGRPGIELSFVVAEGHPANQIVEAAKLWHADFIFAGARGLGPVGRFLLGGTISSILRKAPCSVEVVRSREPNQDTASNRPFRILLATDGSTFSECAVESVAERPWPVGSEVRVISVPVFSALALESGYLNAAEWEATRERAAIGAHEAVDAALVRLEKAGLKIEGFVPMSFDGPKALILAEADQWQADLIVAGSHGRRGLDRFLLGSVSEAVALYAPCSVEVIREKHIREKGEEHHES